MPIHTNLEEYENPALYDLENIKFDPDGPFYLGLAQRLGGAVLELGCGTGRITIPLAEQGVDITGLDLVPGMLERARHKSWGHAVRWVEADARTFQLGRQFSLIFESGGMFQHLLERADQEAMLVCVREHLEHAGRFVISALFPRPASLTTDETERDWFTYVAEQGQEVRVSGALHYDPLRQIQTETAYRRWRDRDGNDVVHRSPLMLRYIFPLEMEALLHYNGFRIEEQFGDWDQRPLTAESKHMIFICRVAE